jgi:hypothetical protein
LTRQTRLRNNRGKIFFILHSDLVPAFSLKERLRVITPDRGGLVYGQALDMTSNFRRIRVLIKCRI